MYESHWQLQGPAFDNGADPTFYYPSEGHQTALLKLRYTVENRKGACLLAGERGAGKTLLAEMLRRQLPESFRPFVHLVFPQMPAADLLAWLAVELCGPQAEQIRSIDGSVRAIQKALAANTAAGKHAVAVIDEAHLIEDSSCWDLLRLLLNFETAGRPDLTLLLAGQLPLVTTISRMPAWEERLALKCLLRPLSAEETGCYVLHRLRTAGTPLEIFTPDALQALHQLANGFPRRINRLADLALLVGFGEQMSEIGAAEVEAVSSELSTVHAE